jgi:hypothetical protein
MLPEMLDVPSNSISLFDDLIAKGERLKDACKKLVFSGTKKGIDAQEFEAWRTSCLTLLRSTFGTSSPHYDSFINVKLFDHYNSTLLYLGIMQGARDDIRKGYFYNKDLMLSVNIFSAFLSKALTQWDAGQGERAMGLLEAVLLETLRRLGASHNLGLEQEHDSARMAARLASQNLISGETRDMIGELAGFLGGAVDGSSFKEWNAWTQKLVYDHLGSRIIIEN